jgi:ribosomal protein S24E
MLYTYIKSMITRLTSPSFSSDVLHPNRPNVSKDELREKLADLYKSNKDQVSVFGFRTQYGGGKSTGFALVYDSAEALKKFEPHYRLVRIGAADKIEKASRQQRASPSIPISGIRIILTISQASNGRTAPRSSAVLPRPRAPRSPRTKRLICDNYGDDGAPVARPFQSRFLLERVVWGRVACLTQKQNLQKLFGLGHLSWRWLKPLLVGSCIRR